MEDQFNQFHFHNNPYFNITPPPPPLHPRLARAPAVQAESTERERLPQWSNTETSEFLAIRAELDPSFMSTKRNKPLWESVSAGLQLKGFSRTPDQCKSKWKNLVTRFKGSEAADHEAGKQFPFYEEMRRIFSRRMERAFALDQKEKGKEVQDQSKDSDGGEEEEEQEEDEQQEQEEDLGDQEEYEQKRSIEERGKKKRKVMEKRKGLQWEIKLALRAIAKQQMEMHARWMEQSEAREMERREKEEEWRRAMVALGEERVSMARRWREREEERSAHAEARAERQHALLMAILTKLTEEEG